MIEKKLSLNEILEVNLERLFHDLFNKNICYTEIKKWDRLWKLVTFDNYVDLSNFIGNEKLLKNYQEKLYSLSHNDEYKKMLLNDIIIENAEREAYFSAGRKDLIEEGIYSNKVEMIINMYNEGLSIDIISKCANLTIQEVEKIINNNINN